MERMELPEADQKRSRTTTFWVVLGAIAGAVLLCVLWLLLNNYIAPEDDPTQRKDVIQAFAVIVGGLVAAGTLLIGWRNLRHNQRTLLINQYNTQETLRNAQEVENRRAQGSSVQAYFEQMGDLLLDKKLREAQTEDEVRILAQAQTHTVLPTLNADRKRSIVVFLHKSMLIWGSDPIVGLVGADLREVDLSKAHLSSINVQGANLQSANLQGANLQAANLQAANLQGVNLQEANLQAADLFGALLTGARLQGVNLQGAVLQSARLQSANLQGAVLQEANLQGTKGLTQGTLERAIIDADTKLPDRFEMPKWGT